MKRHRVLNKEHQELVHIQDDLRKKMAECFELFRKSNAIIDKVVLRHMNEKRKND